MSTAKRRQRRGKQQEYRLVEALKKLGMEIVKYYGHREHGKGDVLAKIGGSQVRFDHKSVQSETSIRLQKDWYTKLTEENIQCLDRDGDALPCITFSIYKSKGIYAMSRMVGGADCMFINTKHKSIPITNGMLIDNGCLKLDFNGYMLWVCKLEDFVKIRRKFNE